ncbi:hypothetical protein RYX36_008640 [Vicia faba]
MVLVSTRFVIGVTFSGDLWRHKVVVSDGGTDDAKKRGDAFTLAFSELSCWKMVHGSIVESNYCSPRNNNSWVCTLCS